MPAKSTQVTAFLADPRRRRALLEFFGAHPTARIEAGAVGYSALGSTLRGSSHERRVLELVNFVSAFSCGSVALDKSGAVARPAPSPLEHLREYRRERERELKDEAVMRRYRVRGWLKWIITLSCGFIGTATFMAAARPSFPIEFLGLADSTWGAAGAVLVLVGVFAFPFLNPRCPACSRDLTGKMLIRRCGTREQHCPQCHVRLV